MRAAIATVLAALCVLVLVAMPLGVGYGALTWLVIEPRLAVAGMEVDGGVASAVVEWGDRSGGWTDDAPVAADLGALDGLADGPGLAELLPLTPHERVLAALIGRPPMVHRLAYCECSNRGGANAIYNPAARGSLQEEGCAQLLPGRGNGLAIFFRWGYTDPDDPDQAFDFIEDVIRGRDGTSLATQYPLTSRGCVGSP